MPITERQRQKRQNALGSSDVAAILGLNPWRTPEDVRLEKLGLLEDEKEPGENDPRTLGNDLENAVLAWALGRLGKLRRNVRRVSHTVLASNIDAIAIEHDGLPVEAKTSGIIGNGLARDEWGEPESDEVPFPVIVQCHVHMICTERDLCYVPALIAGRGYRMYHVMRDDSLADHITRFSAEWWARHVVGNTPSDKPASLTVLKRRKREPKSVVVSADLLKRHTRLKSAQSKITAKVKESERAILDELGDAEVGYSPDFPDKHFSYMEQARKGYTVEPTTIRVARLKKGVPK